MQTNLPGVCILLELALLYQEPKVRGVLLLECSLTLHMNSPGSSWQRWLCHKSCVLLLTLCLLSPPQAGITSHQGGTHLTHLAPFCWPCPCTRMVHFSLGTPTQLLTCNGTNHSDKYEKKRLYHHFYDFWKKLTHMKSNFNWIKPTLIHH